ncbi:MAG: 30S ribosomal protein S20 [Nitrospirota bacterium]
MANHKSALKRNKQSLVRRERNRQAKAALRTIVKSFNTAVAKDPETAKELLASAVPAIAKAASKGIIHKNAASRKISRLSKKLHKSATQGA